MPDDNDGATITQAERFTTVLTGLPWIEVLAQAWKFRRKIMRGLADEGMYEVLEYETTYLFCVQLNWTSSASAKERKKRMCLTMDKRWPVIYTE